MSGVDGMVSILAGGSVSEHSSDESCDRLHGGIHWAIRVRSLRRTFADLASGICAGCVCALPDYVCSTGPDDPEKSGAWAAGEIRRTAGVEARDSESNDRAEQDADAYQTAREIK